MGVPLSSTYLRESVKTSSYFFQMDSGSVSNRAKIESAGPGSPVAEEADHGVVQVPVAPFCRSRAKDPRRTCLVQGEAIDWRSRGEGAAVPRTSEGPPKGDMPLLIKQLMLLLFSSVV